mmetsp:Transcript_7459/g.31601  ORF Transcript_7459/g.31601 Transcript_7459/m.31601 type:complete len:289 (-) Transcript_7459:705-1571(-)
MLPTELRRSGASACVDGGGAGLGSVLGQLLDDLVGVAKVALDAVEEKKGDLRLGDNVLLAGKERARAGQEVLEDVDELEAVGAGPLVVGSPEVALHRPLQRTVCSDGRLHHWLGRRLPHGRLAAYLRAKATLPSGSRLGSSGGEHVERASEGSVEEELGCRLAPLRCRSAALSHPLQLHCHLIAETCCHGDLRVEEIHLRGEDVRLQRKGRQDDRREVGEGHGYCQGTALERSAGESKGGRHSLLSLPLAGAESTAALALALAVTLTLRDSYGIDRAARRVREEHHGH